MFETAKAVLEASNRSQVFNSSLCDQQLSGNGSTFSHTDYCESTEPAVEITEERLIC